MILQTPQPIRLENNLNSISELSTISTLESVNSDLITMFLGEKLGSGSYRSVYAFNPNPDKYVVKIEPLSTNCNANEFLTWENACGFINDFAWAKEWFAPVLWMSPNAKVLIMERTVPEHKKDKPRPDKVPDFLCDVKYDNFGWIGDKFVCHDYGFLWGFLQYGKKMKKANW